AGDADVLQGAVGGVGAHADRRHAAVDGVEAVAAGDEVRRRFGRATDAGELHQILRLEVDPPGGFHYRGGDGVVTAACTQRRERAFVVAAGEAERVLRQRRVSYFGLGYECHGGLLPSIGAADWRQRRSAVLKGVSGTARESIHGGLRRK